LKTVLNRVGSQLHKALTEKGFALLVNHGIPEEKLTTGYTFLDEFCKLSEETKENYLRKGSNHGYIRPGMWKQNLQGANV
jgi:isopenicillin N synthase-like dioxygenase